MNTFWQSLRALPHRRVHLPELRRLWLAAHPEQLQHPERDSLMLDAVRVLAEQGELNWPGPKSFVAGRPSLPLFVTMTERGPVRNDLEQLRRLPWHEELSFGPTLTAAGSLKCAAAINTWLTRRRHRFQPVPLRERSLEIFGDEKFLDGKVRKGALFNDRLPLAAIGAFVVPHPLPYRAADAPGCPVLVVENLHSYWSLAEWNVRVRRFAAVVYGEGNALCSSGPSLAEVLRECGAEGALYFGDLDPAGVRIPLSLNATSAVKVRPAEFLYRFLVEKGTRRSPLKGGGIDESAARQWLPDMAQAVLALWAADQWVPQEALGTEQLTAGDLSWGGEPPRKGA